MKSIHDELHIVFSRYRHGLFSVLGVSLLLGAWTVRPILMVPIIAYLVVLSLYLSSSLLTFWAMSLAAISTALIAFSLLAVGIADSIGAAQFLNGVALTSFAFGKALKCSTSWIRELETPTMWWSVALALGVWALVARAGLEDPMGFIMWWGEDNGNLLDTAARIQNQQHSISLRDMQVSGWLVTPAIASFGLIPNGVSLPFASAEVVVRMYLVTASLCSVTSGLVVACATSTNCKQGKQFVFWFVVGNLASLPYIATSIIYGHLNALLATLIFIGVLSCAAIWSKGRATGQALLTVTPLFLFVVALGGAWIPAVGLSAVLVAALLATLIAYRLPHKQHTQVSRNKLLGVLSLSVLLGYWFWTIRSSLSPSTVINLSSAGGGIAGVGQPVMFATFGAALAYSFVSKRGLLQAVVAGSLLATMFLFGLNQHLEGKPQYGAVKLLTVVVGGLTPIALVGVATLLSHRKFELVTWGWQVLSGLAV